MKKRKISAGSSYPPPYPPSHPSPYPYPNHRSCNYPAEIWRRKKKEEKKKKKDPNRSDEILRTVGWRHESPLTNPPKLIK